MAQLSIQDIIRMMGADNQQLAAMNPELAAMKMMNQTPSGMGQVSNQEFAKMNPALAAMQMQITTLKFSQGSRELLNLSNAFLSKQR